MSGLEQFLDVYGLIVTGVVHLIYGLFFHIAWKKKEHFRSKIKYKYLAIFPIVGLGFIGCGLYDLITQS